MENTPPDNHTEKSYGWKFRVVLAVVPRLLHILATALFHTCRVRYIGKENEDQFIREGKPMLFVT